MEKIDLRTLFLSPEVEHVLIDLVELTQRSSTICSLLELDESCADRVGTLISRIGKREGILASGRRPRGKPRTFDSTNFLQRAQDRIEASVLLSLHRKGPGGSANRTPHLLDITFGPIERVHVLTRTYNKYRSLAVGEADARLSFEDYLVLLAGLAANHIVESVCGCCGARHVHNLQIVNRPECPFCKRDAETLKKAQQTIRERQEERRLEMEQRHSKGCSRPQEMLAG